MSNLKKFTVHSPRKLPVIILADVSGSMESNGKIQTLNRAIASMIDSFAQEEDVRAEINVSVITFGGEKAQIHIPLQPAEKIEWQDMSAMGRTPMGNAFGVAQAMVEDRSIIASRDYHPTIILVSDGIPTDEWIPPLNNLITSERASKALRLSMAIGAEADNEPLQSFLQNQHPEIPVFRADEANQIKQFFRFVTMTITNASKSVNPNSIPVLNFDALDNFDDLDDEYTGCF
ncbi:vWA domain-containing protein [Cyanobacterium aponinum]|uniref:von Willebrand factor type A n=1 Tax=Cyanobacterium aponinum (strain PCC 10605) TaxID=755178 RepID=K9Z5W7_CYAAP|nr:VWA domain-containing protein [Cyanobacterium aponinum]AFZ54581.1 von Willebrand factor type A [Cyanobacterium aponinum PCC 10605]